MSRKLVEVCEKQPRRSHKIGWLDVTLDLGILVMIGSCLVWVAKKAMEFYK